MTGDIYTDFEQYKTPTGFFTNVRGQTSGNDLLYSAEARRALLKAGRWGYPDQWRLEQAIKSNAELEPGLYVRPGWAQDQEAMDDYVGLASISPDIARAIRSYGAKHFWYFKTSPNARWFEPFFWRWVPMLAHISWCAGVTPNPLLRLIWAFTVAYSGSHDGTDAWKLSRLLIDAAGDKGWLERWATRKYWKRLRATWGSLKAVYTEYFGAEHPIAVYCDE